jgi:hypothetical protein
VQKFQNETCNMILCHYCRSRESRNKSSQNCSSSRTYGTPCTTSHIGPCWTAMNARKLMIHSCTGSITKTSVAFAPTHSALRSIRLPVSVAVKPVLDVVVVPVLGVPRVPHRYEANPPSRGPATTLLNTSEERKRRRRSHGTGVSCNMHVL